MRPVFLEVPYCFALNLALDESVWTYATFLARFVSVEHDRARSPSESPEPLASSTDDSAITGCVFAMK